MDLTEAVEAISQADQTEAVSALMDKAKGVFQEVWNKGYKKRQAEDDETVKTAKASAESATTDLGKAQKKITNLEKNQPDVEAIRTEERQAAADTLQGKEEQIAKLKQGRVDDKKAGAKNYMLAQLTNVRGVYARAAVRDAIDERVTFDDDGNMTVYQNGIKVPVATKDGQNPLDVVAAEILKDTPKELVVSTVGSDGTGVDKTGGSGGAGTGEYDKIRTDMKERQESRKGTKEAQEKLDTMFPTAAT